jgi:hypothetical protein
VDILEWFPTKKDEEEAENTPKEKRTEKQNKILEQKEDRRYEEYCKNQRERQRSEYELHMVKSGLKPDKKTYWSWLGAQTDVGTVATSSNLRDFLVLCITEEDAEKVIKEFDMDPDGPVKVLRNLSENEVFGLRCLLFLQKRKLWAWIAQYQLELT